MNIRQLPYSLAGLRIVEGAGLIIIAVSTVIAFGQEISYMWEQGRVALGDLLLMFIYLEVLAMVGVYLSSHMLPVRMPIYIAIVALARYLILDIKAMEDWRIVAVAAAVLVLALAVLVIRYGHLRFPYAGSDAESLRRD